MAAAMAESKTKTEWRVLIDGIGVRTVMSEDIDGAYLATVKEYGCKIDDILAALCQKKFTVDW